MGEKIKDHKHYTGNTTEKQETRNPLKSEDELRYFMNFTSLMGQELIFNKRIIIFRIMKAFFLCFLLQLSSIVVLNLHRESQGHIHSFLSLSENINKYKFF